MILFMDRSARSEYESDAVGVGRIINPEEDTMPKCVIENVWTDGEKIKSMRSCHTE
jgi:hypothetical protein